MAAPFFRHLSAERAAFPPGRDQSLATSPPRPALSLDHTLAEASERRSVGAGSVAACVPLDLRLCPDAPAAKDGCRLREHAGANALAEGGLRDPQQLGRLVEADERLPLVYALDLVGTQCSSP